MRKQLVTVLGSTGSIGRQALDVVAAHGDLFSVFALSAGRNTKDLIDQARQYRPKFVSAAADFDEQLLPEGTRRIQGENAAEVIAAMPESRIVIGGISGISQLKPLLAALNAGKRVALANKESIVCGHALVDAAISAGKGELLPVDSEQSAIFQCLQAGKGAEVRRILLTCSGGPFWRLPKTALEEITIEQALRHPTWRMGKKITIDSATLFNKGLEIIEACYLFHLPPEKVEVVIHPQSIVHSAVEFTDGAVIANAGNPDMRLPIQYAMTYPDRLPSPAQPLSFDRMNGLEFHPADLERFGALKLAYEALREGGSAPIVYNGANEKAVELFLSRRVRFSEIERAVAYAMERHAPAEPASVEEILMIDRAARASVEEYFTLGKKVF